MYKYNSTFHRIAERYATRNSFAKDTNNGYMPLAPKQWNYVPQTTESPDMGALSESKLNRFKSVLRKCDSLNVKLIVTCSPCYMPDERRSVSENEISSICASSGIPFYNNFRLEGMCDSIEFFKDRTHMNDIGATKYTNWFIDNCIE